MDSSVNVSGYGLDFLEINDESTFDDQQIEEDDELNFEEKLMQRSILKNLITGRQMSRITAKSFSRPSLAQTDSPFW